MNRHLEELHTSKAQYKCIYRDCKRYLNGFSRSANLKNHMRKVHNTGSDCGGVGSGGGGTGSNAPSENADNSGGENDSPPGQRYQKRPRVRTRDQVLKEFREVEREVVVREEEYQTTQKRRVDVRVRLDQLRAELEDGRFPSSSLTSPMNLVSSSSFFAGISSPPPAPHLPAPSSSSTQYSWPPTALPAYAGSSSFGTEISAGSSSSSSQTYCGVSAYYSSPPTPPADSSFYHSPPSASATHSPSVTVYPNTPAAWSQPRIATSSTIWPGGC